MTDIELITYLLVFALSVIFSTFAIDRKSITFSFLSMVLWFTLAITHVALAYQTMLLSIAYMFFGVGIVFMVFGFVIVIESFKARKQQREWAL